MKDNDLDDILRAEIEETDEDGDTSGNKGSSGSSGNKGDGGDSSNLRDKDAELKKKIKSYLSDDTSFVIDSNEEEMNEIIEKMKNMGISKDNGLELQKIRSMKKSARIIGK